jgi:LPXTG-motif cell wall-anchored protein
MLTRRPGRLVLVPLFALLSTLVSLGWVLAAEPSASAITVVTVTGASFTATQGVTFSGGVATFTDSNPAVTLGDLSATINWGDGTTTPAASITTVSGGFAASGTHLYAAPGTFTTSVVVTDSTGPVNGTGIGSATVASELTGTPVAITATQNLTFSGPVATATDAVAGQPIVDYSATIDWGDGTTTAASSIAAVGGTLTVNGNHAWAQPGTFSVTTTLTVNGVVTATATVTSTATVAPELVATPIAITATEGVAFSGPVATATDADTSHLASDYTATINWGDGTTSAASSITDSAGALTITASHTWAAPGTFTVTTTLTVSGLTTASVTVSSTATVAPTATTTTTSTTTTSTTSTTTIPTTTTSTSSSTTSTTSVIAPTEPTVPASGATTGSLPVTGADLDGIIVTALGLLVLGGLAVVSGRRSRR